MHLYIYYTKNGNKSQVLFLTLYLGRYAPSRHWWAVPTAKLGLCDIKFVTTYPESAVPTAKLDVCDIKIVTAYPDGII